MEIPNHIKRALKCGKFPPMRDWRNVSLSQCTRAERNMKFIEGYFKIPEGDKVGEPLRLTLFQEVFFYCVFDAPRKIRRVIFSIARKNAKTALIAIIDILFIVGPEAIQNSRLNSAAQTREQASEVFNYASKIIQQSEKLSSMAKVVTSSKKIIGIRTRVEYRAISSDAKSNIGGSPLIAIIDEAGQIKGAQDELVEAILTGQLAYENAMHFIISTQASSDGDWLSVQIDDAINNQPDDVICFLFAADENCDLLDEEQWLNANPALGDFLSKDNLKKLLTEAQRMPSLEMSRRNLNLNQRVNTDSPFVAKSVWQSCGDDIEIPIGAKVWLGLDLSAVQDLTALVMIAQVGERWAVRSWFWLPADGLREKSEQDRVPYDLWHKQGLLETTQGRVINYDFVAHHLREIFKSYDVQKLAFDRWRIDAFKAACSEVGFTEDMLARFANFGQGFKDMSPALRELEADLLNGKIAHGNHPVLSMCAANAVVLSDPAGNRKLVKPKERHRRIDGMIALVMARGVAIMESELIGATPWDLDADFKLEL